MLDAPSVKAAWWGETASSPYADMCVPAKEVSSRVPPPLIEHSTLWTQCVSTVDAGGPIDSLLISGGYLFAGVQKLDEAIVKVWNMQTGAMHMLPGHRVSAVGVLWRSRMRM